MLQAPSSRTTPTRLLRWGDMHSVQCRRPAAAAHSRRHDAYGQPAMGMALDRLRPPTGPHGPTAARGGRWGLRGAAAGQCLRGWGSTAKPARGQPCTAETVSTVTVRSTAEAFDEGQARRATPVWTRSTWRGTAVAGAERVPPHRTGPHTGHTDQYKTRTADRYAGSGTAGTTIATGIDFALLRQHPGARAYHMQTRCARVLEWPSARVRGL